MPYVKLPSENTIWVTGVVGPNISTKDMPKGGERIVFHLYSDESSAASDADNQYPGGIKVEYDPEKVSAIVRNKDHVSVRGYYRTNPYKGRVYFTVTALVIQHFVTTPTAPDYPEDSTVEDDMTF